MISRCLDPVVSWWADLMEFAAKNIAMITAMDPKSMESQPYGVMVVSLCSLVYPCGTLFIYTWYVIDIRG